MMKGNHIAKQKHSIHSISMHLNDIYKTLVILLLFFLLVFNFLFIFKTPSSSTNHDGLFSSFLNTQSQPSNQGVSNTNTNTSKEYTKGSKELTKFPHKNYEYDKFLGGLLVSGLNDSSCLSRYRWNKYRKPAKSTGRGRHRHRHRQPSPHLISKLRQYESLHKQCGPHTLPYIAAVESLNGAGDVGHNVNSTECKYILWAPPEGLGNRMLSLASAFLYALLTNRILVHRQDDGNFSDLFCDPFPDSSWSIPFGSLNLSGFNIHDQSFPYSFGNMVKNRSFGKIVPAVVYLNLNNYFNEDDKQFYCDDEDHQTNLEKVIWVILSSNQYFVPYLFLMPSFEQELDNLFPDKQSVFHHLGRYLFNPSNAVWGLITRYYKGYLAQADELLGIQIRIAHDKEGGPLKHILDQILSCTTIETLLPKLHDDDNNNDDNPVINTTNLLINTTDHDHSRKLAVLVTSLRSGYYDILKNMYLQKSTVSDVSVSFYQPSHEETQKNGNQIHDRKALAEIYLLSLTDKLVISGWSTFGYVANSLGGLQPWILYPTYDLNIVPNPPCKLSSSMEPCFHFAPSSVVCRNKTMDVDDVVPYIKHCEDVVMGVKLFDKDQ